MIKVKMSHLYFQLISDFFQILPYLRNAQFNNTAGDEVTFSENGLGSAQYDLLNWVLFPNESFVPVKVGQVKSGTPPGQDFMINSDEIIWATKVSWEEKL